MTQPVNAQPKPIMGTALPPKELPQENHGHTVASWVAMIIIMIAGVVSLGGFIFDINWLAWVGLPIAVLGLIIGGVLRVLGYGQPRKGENPEA